MEAALLEMICCPVTQQSLSLADAAVLERVNAQIATGTVKAVGGQVISAPLENALMREDGRMLYPIRSDIPVLLPDEGISL